MANLNVVPPFTNEIISTNSKTFASTGTQNISIWRILGTIEVRGIWGVVTTVIGVNHTAASFRLNDQTAQIYITAIGGVALSGLAAGTVIVKTGLAAAAITKMDNVAGAITEPTTLETMVHSPFLFTKKTAANTDIEYHFATTDNPTTGVMQFFLRYVPISADAAVTPQ